MLKISGWRKAIVLLTGLQLGTDGQFKTGKRRDFVRRIGYRFALIYLLPLCLLHIAFVFDQPRFGPASNVEESAYTYTSANNYLKFGFLNSALLQDFSNSPFPEDHPFVYTHMPAGPDVFTALLLMTTGSDYRLVRFVFFALFLVGVCCYIKVIEQILHRQGLSGGGFALVFVWPWIVIQGMERIIYSPFLLFAFAPVALLAAQNHKRWQITKCTLAAILSFVASIYLEYSLLSGVLAFWFLIFMLKVLPGNRRAVFLLLIPAFSGIFAHLVQNYIFLGHEVFWKELVYVLSNRMSGYPSQLELKDWYLENGLVHHGSQPVSLRQLWTQINANFSVTGVKSAVLLALVSLAAGFHIWLGKSGKLILKPSTRSLNAGGGLIRTAIVVGVPVIVPIILFPAFAQEVNLRGSGANSYFLAILGCMALALVNREIWRRVQQTVSIIDGEIQIKINQNYKSKSSPVLNINEVVINVVKKILILAFGAILIVGVLYVALFFVKVRSIDFINVARVHFGSKVHLVESLKAFKGKAFMTNINVPTIGFVIEYPGFGVCSPESISPEGEIDTSGCKIAFVRRFDYWKEQRPEIFVFFRDRSFFPGFAQCVPNVPESKIKSECVEKFESNLRKHFPVKEENGLFTVFDLATK